MLKMLESEANLIPKLKSLAIPCLVSLVSVFFTQFSLFLLPLFLSTSSLLTLLPLSGVLIVIVIGLGSCCKKVVGVRASAPAFVLFTIFFIWGVYVFVVRRAISCLEDILFNTEIVLVIIGLCRFMVSDPGIVTHHTSSHDLHIIGPPTGVETLEEELKISHNDVQQELQFEDGLAHRRVRYCKHCKTYIMGFDHHCPAFGNCVGQKNHLFFLVLLLGLLISELTYVYFAFHYNAKYQTLYQVGKEMGNTSRCLVLSTTSFSLIQVLWQVIFTMWHVHCACFNIKTDEWINWKKYPEFHIRTSSHTGQLESAVQFVNPYNKGMLRNLKEFLIAKG